MAGVLGGDLGLGARDIPVFGGRGVVLHRPRQWSGLMNNQDVVLVVLPQVLLGEVKPLHAGDLQLKQRGGSVDLNAGDCKGACEGRRDRACNSTNISEMSNVYKGRLCLEFAEKMVTCKNLKSTRIK